MQGISRGSGRPPSRPDFGRRLAGLGVLVLSAILLAGSPFPARADWPAVTREEMELEADPLGSQPAVILFERGVTDDGASERTQTIHRRVKILTKAGVDRSTITISIIEPDQRFESLEARSVKPNGRESNLTNLEAVSRRQNPDGTTEISFRIPDAAVGDIIEYRYAIKGGGIPPLGGWVFQHDVPCLESRYVWRPSLAMTSHWTMIGTEPFDPSIVPLVSDSAVDSLEAVQFEIRNLPAGSPETLGPPLIETRPRLVTTYTSMAIAPGDFWDVFAIGAAEREAEFSADSRDLERELAALEGFPDDFEGRIRRAYAFAQSWLAADAPAGADVPPVTETATADSVLAGGSTNHEGVHLLFVAALKVLGIEAHRAFVVDRDQAFFHHELQSPAQFSRTVVAITQDTTRAFFFSPGTPFAPPGILPWYIQGVTALIADPDGARFTRTPVDEPAANQVTQTSELRLDAAGGVEGTMHFDFSGQAEIEERRVISHGPDELKAALQAVWRGRIPDLTAGDLETRNEKDPDRNLTVDVSIRSIRFGSLADNRLLIRPAALNRSGIDLPDGGPRLQPVFFPYAGTEIHSLTLAIPREWRLDTVPDLIDFENAAGHYRSIWSFDGEKLVYQRSLVLNRAMVPVEDYAKLRALLDTAEAGDATLVPLVKVALRPSERGR